MLATDEVVPLEFRQCLTDRWTTGVDMFSDELLRRQLLSGFEGSAIDEPAKFLGQPVVSRNRRSRREQLTRDEPVDRR